MWKRPCKEKKILQVIFDFNLGLPTYIKTTEKASDQLGLLSFSTTNKHVQYTPLMLKFIVFRQSLNEMCVNTRVIHFSLSEVAFCTRLRSEVSCVVAELPAEKVFGTLLKDTSL